MNTFDWDDLRFFYTLAETQSLVKAAKDLGVNQTTVARRLDSFEQELGNPLFVRERNCFILTEYGRMIHKSCEEICGNIHTLERKISAGAYGEKKSLIRVSLPDFIFKDCIEKHVEKFHINNPNITLSFLITNDLLDLSNNDADIVLRIIDNPKEHLSDTLYGRYIAPIKMQAYSNRNCSEKDRTWIGWGRNANFASWIKQNNYPVNTISLELDSVLSQRDMMEHGNYAAILPSYMTKIIKHSAPIDDLAAFHAFDVWIGTHVSLKDVPSIKTVKDFLSVCFQRVIC